MRKVLYLLLLVQVQWACTNDIQTEASELDECGNGIPILLSSLIDSLVYGNYLPAEFVYKIDSANVLSQNCFDFGIDSLKGQLNERWGRKKLASGDLLEARKYLSLSLKARQRMYPEGRHRNILRMFHNIGLTYSRLNDPHNALLFFDSADLWTPQVSPRPFLDTKLRKGQAYFSIGEYQNANFHLKAAYDSLLTYQGVPSSIRTQIVRSLASTYRKMKQYHKAYKLGETEIKYQLDELKQPNSLEMANLFLVLGNTLQDSLLMDLKNEFLKSQAIWYTSTALNYYQQNQASTQLRIAAGNLGELYRRIGDLDKAERVLNKAISQIKQIDTTSPLLAQLYINRGETKHGKGRIEEALLDYDSCYQLLVPEQKSINYQDFSLPNSSVVTDGEIMTLMGDIALANLDIFLTDSTKQGNLAHSQLIYDKLIQIINRVRGDFVSDQAKLDLAASSQEALQKALSSSLLLAKINQHKRSQYLEDAFLIAEQSKTFLSLEATRLNMARNSMDKRLKDLEKELLSQQILLEDALLGKASQHQLRDSILQLQQQNFDAIRAFQQRLKSEQPNIYASKYQGINIAISDIQNQLLEKKQVLVEYFLQEKFIYTFVITKDDFQLIKTSISLPKLQQQVQNYRSLLENNSLSKVEEQSFISLGTSLYQILISPFEHLLQERLIIVPAGILNNLPFEALMPKQIPGTLDEQSQNENFLLFDQAISYCFSSSLLDLMDSAKKPKPNKKGPAVFASYFHPQLSKQSSTRTTSAFLQSKQQFLTPLGLNQATEVTEILERFPRSELFEMEAANQNNFQGACENQAIIHLITHGILNEVDPNFSFISFSQMQATLDIKELMFVKELFGQRNWNLDLLFLSACQTAAGKYYSGEGNISMASALAQAGVRSLITTHWNIPTAPKAKIAPLFYQYYLIDKQDKDLALTKAKQAIASSGAKPYDWAGLVLIGSVR